LRKLKIKQENDIILIRLCKEDRRNPVRRHSHLREEAVFEYEFKIKDKDNMLQIVKLDAENLRFYLKTR